jgi:hypothetical protein
MARQTSGATSSGVPASAPTCCGNALAAPKAVPTNSGSRPAGTSRRAPPRKMRNASTRMGARASRRAPRRPASCAVRRLRGCARDTARESGNVVDRPRRTDHGPARPHGAGRRARARTVRAVACPRRSRRRPLRSGRHRRRPRDRLPADQSPPRPKGVPGQAAGGALAASRGHWLPSARRAGSRAHLPVPRQGNPGRSGAAVANDAAPAARPTPEPA